MVIKFGGLATNDVFNTVTIGGLNFSGMVRYRHHTCTRKSLADFILAV